MKSNQKAVGGFTESTPGSDDSLGRVGTQGFPLANRIWRRSSDTLMAKRHIIVTEPSRMSFDHYCANITSVSMKDTSGIRSAPPLQGSLRFCSVRNPRVNPRAILHRPFRAQEIVQIQQDPDRTFATRSRTDVVGYTPAVPQSGTLHPFRGWCFGQPGQPG